MHSVKIGKQRIVDDMKQDTLFSAHTHPIPSALCPPELGEFVPAKSAPFQ